MKLSCSLLECKTAPQERRTASWVRNKSVVTQHWKPQGKAFWKQVNLSLAIGDVGTLWITHLKLVFPKPQNPKFRRGLRACVTFFSTYSISLGLLPSLTAGYAWGMPSLGNRIRKESLLLRELNASIECIAMIGRYLWSHHYWGYLSSYSYV